MDLQQRLTADLLRTTAGRHLADCRTVALVEWTTDDGPRTAVFTSKALAEARDHSADVRELLARPTTGVLDGRVIFTAAGRPSDSAAARAHVAAYWAADAARRPAHERD